MELSKRTAKAVARLEASIELYLDGVYTYEEFMSIHNKRGDVGIEKILQQIINHARCERAQ